MSAATDFWSKRIAGVQAEADAELAIAEAKQREADLAAVEEKTDKEVFAELNLPDPDTLGDGDDFKAFMSKTVPDRIRRRALRKLWLSNPALANLDGLIEYGEDYTDSATVVENLQTAYQVGKGMLKYLEELANTDDEAETPSEPDGDLEHVSDGVEIASALTDAEPEAKPKQESPEQAGPPRQMDLASDAKPIPMRRMRFRFSSESEQLQGHEAKG